MASLNIAVVITVYNEENSLPRLFDSLKKQTLQPREVVIVDGGSSDSTYEMLKKESSKWRILKVFQKSGNRSVGRNFGVSQSGCSVIVFTDAGCFPDPDWLFEITRPFQSPQVMVVSGYYRGVPENIFQKCLIPYVLVMPDRAAKTEFFPSTRSMALRRSVWIKSGGFDSRLYHNEDYAFAHWLKKLGYVFVFAPAAFVNWIPRKNLRQTAWMFLRFAIGDIQSGIFRPQVKRLFIRFWLFTVLFFLAYQIHILFFALVPLLILYFIFAIMKNYRYVKDVRAVFWLPVLQLTADISVILGSAMGFLSTQKK
jgi:glycosyltransferase involved in cell wall biosynthesis